MNSERAATLLLVVALFPLRPASAAGEVHFVDIAGEAGVVAPTWCGGVEKPHLLESGGTSLALVDYDGDGDLDLYLVNGWRLDGHEIAERGRNVLYRNRGDGTFDDVSAASGLDDDGWGTAIAMGDPNGDGLPDLLVSNFGEDVLYGNQGDGTFEPVPGAPSIEGWSTGGVFFDGDGDGDDDLYLAAYVEATLDEVLHATPDLEWEGEMVMSGPFGLPGKANAYFENLGDGNWRDATMDSGLEDVGLFFTFAVAAADLDGDLDPDLYAANDSNPNYLYDNQGGGNFEEVGLWSGAALDEMGNAQAGMGLALADLDADGLIDLLVTNFYHDVSTLYRNKGDFIFDDATEELGLKQSTFMPLSWGTTFADLDLDGDLDIFVANGHIYPQADIAPEADTTFRQRNLVLLNEGDRFADASSEAGPGLAVEESSRGLAVGDIDGDGDIDLAVANVDAPATLLRNDTETDGGWLIVDAPRALKVELESGDRKWIQHRVAGGSYVSVSDPRFHFGLPGKIRPEKMRIVWEDGSAAVMMNPGRDRVLRIP